MLDSFVYAHLASPELVAAIAAAEAGGNINLAAAQVMPVLIAQSSQAAQLTLTGVANAISARSLNRGLATGDAGREKHLWVRVFGSSAEQDDKSNAAGFEVENYGVVVGFDGAVSDNFIFGVAAGYSQPEAESKSSLIDHEIEIDGFQIAAYADWNGDNRSFVELIGVVGFNQNDSERHITFGGLNRTARGEYDSNYFRLYAAYGRSYDVSEKFTISPTAYAGYTKVDEDGYTEEGAGDLNLDVSSNEAESLIIGIDGRGAYQISDNGSQITGYVGLGYDLATDDAILAASFVGGGPVFRTVSDEPDEFVIRAGIGIEWMASERGEIHLRYGYENRGDFTNQLLTATFRWAL